MDLTGHEEDGYNEAICPVDFREAGLVIDDDSGFADTRTARGLLMADDSVRLESFKEARGKKSEADARFNTMVRPLPAGCRLTMIFDSCHSGTVGDLPYCVSCPLGVRAVR